MNYSQTIGINLSFNNARVSIAHKNKSIEIIPSFKLGTSAIPCFISFTEEGELVGDEIPDNFLYNSNKTCININGQELIDLFESDDPQFQFNNFNNMINKKNENSTGITMTQHRSQSNKLVFQLENHHRKYQIKQFYPEEILAKIIHHLKKIAETFLGRSLKQAVITTSTPHLNKTQRQMIQNAGIISGFDAIHFLEEPKAAIMGHKFKNSIPFPEKQRILVYNLGASTFHVSCCLSVQNESIEIESTFVNNTHLGGRDFDHRLVDWCVQDFKRRNRVTDDIMNSCQAWRRLQNACEEAKKRLSKIKQTNIVVESLFQDMDYSVTLSRSRFESLNSDLLDQCVNPIRELFHRSSINSNPSFDDIVLVGGSTNIPYIRNYIYHCFSSQFKEIRYNSRHEETIALGTAIEAARVHNNTKNPRSSNESFFQSHLCCALHLTTLSLNIETWSGFTKPIIRRLTCLPCRRSCLFSPYFDHHRFKRFKIRIFERERKLITRHNHSLLGEMELFIDGLDPFIKQERPRIKITFDINIDRVLNVSAQVLDSKIENSISITNFNEKHCQFSVDTIDQLVKNGKEFQHFDEDKYQETVCNNFRNRFENDIISMFNENNDNDLDQIESINEMIEIDNENINYQNNNNKFNNINNNNNNRMIDQVD